ncbi:MAG: ABC transporter permease [Planctomycetota bacterium]
MLSNWNNLVARRDLLKELVVSELRSQTHGTLLGWLWWLVDPLVMMVIYWGVVVGVLGRGESYAPYPIFVLCGLLPWKHLSYSVNRSTTVLAGSEGLIKAIPFPTMVLPLGRVGSGFICFLFGLAVLLVAAAVWGCPPSVALVQVPGLLAAQLLLVAGLSLGVAAVGVMLRDLAVAMQHLMRVGLYLTPVIYGLDMVRDKLGEPWFTLYLMNPFAIVIEGYRSAIFEGAFMNPWYWPVLAAQSVAFFGVGYAIYRHYDRRVIKFL